MTLISANWKMHLNHIEALELVQQLAERFRASTIPAGREVSIHPPFTCLAMVGATIAAERVPISLGAQTCHYADAGAHTGEVSAGMLAALKVRYVIAGHSERRARGETDQVVREKIDAIYRHTMQPILCVGETADERHRGVAEEKVRQQLAAALSGRPAELVAAAVIAYEPLWAIGTGATASPDDVANMCSAIRDELERVAGTHAAAMVRIQYGGSVTAETCEALLSGKDVDGFLIGGASLDAEQFSAIVIG
ncbi:MAG: triose-phosphate isomerase [Acidobacteria bacterium]|nr:triose-phosphate isomerase [Acidobacteriota bacterium]